MRRSVREKADSVATYRFVAVFLMETLARWVPTSPELEAKALFGRHVWDLAQLADQLGRRTAELRLALHQNRAPVPAYKAALDLAAGMSATSERIAAFYDGILPDLTRRLETSLAGADPLLDDPTIRIAERALAEFARMRRQRDEMVGERPDLGTTGATGTERVAVAAASVEDLTDYRPAPAADVA